MKKILCLLLSLSCLFSTFATGCNKVNSNTKWEDIESDKVSIVEMSKAFVYLGDMVAYESLLEEEYEDIETAYPLSVTAKLQLTVTDKEESYKVVETEVIEIETIDNSFRMYLYKIKSQKHLIEGEFPAWTDQEELVKSAGTMTYNGNNLTCACYIIYGEVRYLLDVGLFGYSSNSLEKFEYDEEQKAYNYYETKSIHDEETATTEENIRCYQFKFKNGKLVACRIQFSNKLFCLDTVITFYNYNNTTVDLG